MRHKAFRAGLREQARLHRKTILRFRETGSDLKITLEGLPPEKACI